MLKQPPKVMHVGIMITATECAMNRVLAWIALAEEVKMDARKTERLKRQECKSCFYASRIGGSAMTERPCMCCGSVMVYTSTATDVLCPGCAQKHQLCKHCGGDLEMRSRRKDWPKPNVSPQADHD